MLETKLKDTAKGQVKRIYAVKLIEVGQDENLTANKAHFNNINYLSPGVIFQLLYKMTLYFIYRAKIHSKAIKGSLNVLKQFFIHNQSNQNLKVIIHVYLSLVELHTKIQNKTQM